MRRRLATIVGGVAGVYWTLAGYSLPAQTGPTPSVHAPLTPLAARQWECEAELALQADPVTYPYSIRPLMQQGVLELRGYVPSLAVKERAVSLVQSAVPVPVADRLKVFAQVAGPMTTRSADPLAQARARLSHAGLAPGATVTVDQAEDGLLVLRGQVATLEQKMALTKSLRGLPGCVAVRNEVTVTARESAPEKTVAFPPAPALPPLAGWQSVPQRVDSRPSTAAATEHTHQEGASAGSGTGHVIEAKASAKHEVNSLTQPVGEQVKSKGEAASFAQIRTAADKGASANAQSVRPPEARMPGIGGAATQSAQLAPIPEPPMPPSAPAQVRQATGEVAAQRGSNPGSVSLDRARDGGAVDKPSVTGTPARVEFEPDSVSVGRPASVTQQSAPVTQRSVTGPPRMVAGATAYVRPDGSQEGAKLPQSVSASASANRGPQSVSPMTSRWPGMRADREYPATPMSQMPASVGSATTGVSARPSVGAPATVTFDDEPSVRSGAVRDTKAVPVRPPAASYQNLELQVKVATGNAIRDVRVIFTGPEQVTIYGRVRAGMDRDWLQRQISRIPAFVNCQVRLELTED